jgi:spore germination cell wall hydrolase CwlJ-like protein
VIAVILTTVPAGNTLGEVKSNRVEIAATQNGLSSFMEESGSASYYRTSSIASAYLIRE